MSILNPSDRVLVCAHMATQNTVGEPLRTDIVRSVSWAAEHYCGTEVYNHVRAEICEAVQEVVEDGLEDVTENETSTAVYRAVLVDQHHG